MRLPACYVMCAALAVAVNSEQQPLHELASNYYSGQQQQQPSLSYEDQEALGYLFPRLMARYASGAVAPRWPPAVVDGEGLYPVPDGGSNDFEQQGEHAGLSKRHDNKPSLSITNSLDVLRNRLLLEMSRKNAKSNRDLLCKIGKRSPGGMRRNCDEPM